MRKTGHIILLSSAFLLSACSRPLSAPETREHDVPKQPEAEMGPQHAADRPGTAGSNLETPELSSESLREALAADLEAASRYRALAADIETIIPRDAIPAIDEPSFWSADEADGVYKADERVIGLDIEGEQRAYSVPFLSGVEIVNDELGGRPISVTW